MQISGITYRFLNSISRVSYKQRGSYLNKGLLMRTMCIRKHKDFDESEAHMLLAEVPKLLKQGNVLNHEEGDLVLEFKHPAELKKIVDFSVCAPNSYDKMLSLCCSAIRYSVRTANPHFHNQLYSGPDIYGLVGGWILDALNTNIHTYEISPFFTLCEEAVIRHVLEIMKFPEDPENPTKDGDPVGDGILGPGGSIGNMYGMILARYKISPEVKAKGLLNLDHKQQLVAFTSVDSHYSFQKAAHLLGIGIDNLIGVETDACGLMSPSDLKDKISAAKADNKCPFFVNATAGTTVLGVIDPLDEIANVCKEHKVWCHVDACLAGSLMFSRKYGCRLDGINMADSVVWNPHKLIGAPLQCSVFVTKHKHFLMKSNCASATYLFQQDKFYDVAYDTGDKSMQCGRKPDAFKLWMMWKARGDAGFEKLMDNAMCCSEHFKKVIRGMDGFRLVQELTHTTCVCFWYIPPCMRNQIEDEDWYKRLNLVAPKMKEMFMLNGAMMIGYAPLPSKGLKNFFRMTVTCQPPKTFEDMEYVACEIQKVGATIPF